VGFLTQLYECSECGQVLQTDDDTDCLLPCSRCGATSSKPIKDIQERVTIKFKQVGATGSPDLRIKIADELYQETGEWRQIKMSVDKTNDDYEKTVINPETDEVLYHNREPLSHHTGRGSAKRKATKSKR
jgi:DNA-directed RNA polymerase subunit M/transcription elongation factor TFIIS